MFETSDSVPLKTWQKARLIGGCVPFVGFLVLAVVFTTVFRDLFIKVPPVVLYLFIVLVLVVTGFQAVQRIRDLLLGMALVEDDVLERSWRGGGRGAGSAIFFGKFERLGKLCVMRKAHFESQNGERYRVIYSPVSRIVWALEPV
jgi:polyferredoxin